VLLLCAALRADELLHQLLLLPVARLGACHRPAGRAAALTELVVCGVRTRVCIQAPGTMRQSRKRSRRGVDLDFGAGEGREVGARQTRRPKTKPYGRAVDYIVAEAWCGSSAQLAPWQQSSFVLRACSARLTHCLGSPSRSPPHTSPFRIQSHRRLPPSTTPPPTHRRTKPADAPPTRRR
jgi:hypothetical protein